MNDAIILKAKYTKNIRLYKGFLMHFACLFMLDRTILKVTSTVTEHITETKV